MKIIQTNIEKLISGINKAADIIVPTLGPSGGNVIIGRPYQYPIIVNDGGTIADHIFFEDETEQLSVDVIKEATSTADKISADGRTSTVAILRHLINVLYAKTKGLSKENPIELEREVNTLLQKSMELLKKQKKEIKSLRELKNIAFVSLGNKEISDKIAELYWKIGKDGVINIEDNFEPEIAIETKNGLEIPFGITSEHLVKELEDAPILISKVKVDTVSQIENIYNQVRDSKVYKLVIIAPEFNDGVVSEFKGLFGSFNIIPIKIPLSNIEVYEDVSAITGAKLITDKLEETKIAELGGVSKITTGDKTTIIGTVDPEKHIKEILEKKIDSLYDKDLQENRIARLRNGVIIFKLGFRTDQEREYYRLKIRDSIKSTRNALRTGYVQGGGIALKKVAESLGDTLISESLKEPFNMIQKNHGKELEINPDVIDAYLTVEQELITACKLAGKFITTHASIADKAEKSEDPVL